MSQDLSENIPSYYANIPADVRYSKEICDGAKLLYGEITALANIRGYSWASNSYFAKVYDKDTNTISRWIKELTEAGFIRVVIDKQAGNIRRIYLSPKINIPIYKNEDTPIPKNRVYNNIKKNNKKNIINSKDLELNIEERKKKFYNAIMLYKKNNPSKYPYQLYEIFFKHWIETNELNGGGKMRFEDQKFFQVGSRIATFWTNTPDPKRGEMWKQDEATSKPKLKVPELFKVDLDENEN